MSELEKHLNEWKYVEKLWAWGRKLSVLMVKLKFDRCKTEKKPATHSLRLWLVLKRRGEGIRHQRYSNELWRCI